MSKTHWTKLTTDLELLRRRGLRQVPLPLAIAMIGEPGPRFAELGRAFLSCAWTQAQPHLLRPSPNPEWARCVEELADEAIRLSAPYHSPRATAIALRTLVRCVIKHDPRRGSLRHYFAKCAGNALRQAELRRGQVEECPVESPAQPLPPRGQRVRRGIRESGTIAELPEDMKEALLGFFRGALPANQFAAWTQFHQDGAKQTDIATKLNVPVGTVKSWMSRIRKRYRLNQRLRQLLKNTYNNRSASSGESETAFSE